MFYQTVLAKNRPSPFDEEKWIAAYKKVFPSAEREDNYDIAAVVTQTGIYGHALMHESYNRNHNTTEYHVCYNFISDDELAKYK